MSVGADSVGAGRLQLGGIEVRVGGELLDYGVGDVVDEHSACPVALGWGKRGGDIAGDVRITHTGGPEDISLRAALQLFRASQSNRVGCSFKAR